MLSMSRSKKYRNYCLDYLVNYKRNKHDMVRSLHATQLHNTLRVICEILRHRPCHNFLPGVLCVAQGHRITSYGS